jgi:hypothetical protein
MGLRVEHHLARAIHRETMELVLVEVHKILGVDRAVAAEECSGSCLVVGVHFLGTVRID